MVSCPIECVKDQPDFIERNGAWLLSVIASISACLGYCLSYFLKSRCKTIDCCGMKCDRTPIELKLSDHGGLHFLFATGMTTSARHGLPAG